MVFFLEIKKKFSKSLKTFGFADFFLEFFYPLAGMDFPMVFSCIECVSSMLCSQLLLILNFTMAVLSKTTFRSIFVS